jgi:hypothetical protein
VQRLRAFNVSGLAVDINNMAYIALRRQVRRPEALSAGYYAPDGPMLDDWSLGTACPSDVAASLRSLRLRLRTHAKTGQVFADQHPHRDGCASNAATRVPTTRMEGDHAVQRLP